MLESFVFERRSERRLEVVADMFAKGWIKARLPSGALGQIVDLSAGGMAIRTSETPDEHTIIELTVGDASFELPLTLKNTRQEVHGFSWHQLSFAAGQAMQELLWCLRLGSELRGSLERSRLGDSLEVVLTGSRGCEAWARFDGANSRLALACMQWTLINGEEREVIFSPPTILCRTDPPEGVFLERKAHPESLAFQWQILAILSSVQGRCRELALTLAAQMTRPIHQRLDEESP